MRIARMSVVAVALLVAVGLCFAADAMKINGTVKSVDVAKNAFVIVEGGKEFAFAVTTETKIAEGDAVKTLADIKEGMHVAVEYTVAGEAKTAVSITVRK